MKYRNVLQAATLIFLFSLTARSQDDYKFVITLEGGRELLVEEAVETSEGVWFRRNGVTTMMDRSRIKSIRKVSAVPPPPPPKPPKLGPNYTGLSVASVFQALRPHQRRLEKSEFETTADYERRVDGILAGVSLAGGAKANGPLTFVIGDPEVHYDADAATYSVGLADPEEYVVAGSSKYLGRAVGQNAFGVKIRYKIYRYDQLRLVMRASGLSASKLGVKLENIQPARARQMAGGLALALTGKLARPFAGTSSDHSAATISEPEEAYFHYTDVFFRPETLTVFNQRTGEVFKVVDVRSLERDYR